MEAQYAGPLTSRPTPEVHLGGHRLSRTRAHEAGTPASHAGTHASHAGTHAGGAHDAGAAHGTAAGAGSTRPAPTPVRVRVIAAAALAAAGAVGLATALPAWADTTPTLSDTHVLAATAADQGTGHCGVPQDPGQDVWVFTWPGGSAGSLEQLTVRYDSDGDEVADTSRTEAGAANLSTAKLLKYAVTTPAGWLLVDGTSLITGTAAQNQFRLAAVCAGQASAVPTPQPGVSPPAPTSGGRPSGAVTSGAPASSAAGASASPTAAASSVPASPSQAPWAAGVPGGLGGSWGTPQIALPRSPDTQLAASRRPVTPYVAAGLVLVAASGTLLGVRRRRAQALAASPVRDHRRGGAHTARHRRA